MTIEEALEKLEGITQKLEKEDLGLEESIALFDEGLGLAATIKTQLEDAKLRVEQVLEKTRGTFALEPLDLP
ncbi:MAG: exodeoxyribonuclease VII small subunit [Candidatus Bipolaricaulia bacterium]